MLNLFAATFRKSPKCGQSLIGEGSEPISAGGRRQAIGPKGESCGILTSLAGSSISHPTKVGSSRSSGTPAREQDPTLGLLSRSRGLAMELVEGGTKAGLPFSDRQARVARRTQPAPDRAAG